VELGHVSAETDTFQQHGQQSELPGIKFSLMTCV